MRQVVFAPVKAKKVAARTTSGKECIGCSLSANLGRLGELGTGSSSDEREGVSDGPLRRDDGRDLGSSDGC